MDADEFLRTATDPEEWLAKSAALRRTADRLWDSFMEATVFWGKSARAKASGVTDDEIWEEASAYLTSAKFFYGLALETAFKACILQQRPGDIEFKLTADGTSAVQQAQVTHFGVSLGSGHDLEQLGEKAGVFARHAEPIFKADSDYRALREILRHLSEVVRWSGRYPVPLRSGVGHEVPPDVPAKVFGHYIRDWTDNVLDRYQKGAWKPSRIVSPARMLDMVQRHQRLKEGEKGEG